MSLTRRAALPLLLLPLSARAETFDIEALMARLAGIPERRATFREERTLQALTTPLVSTGRLLYRRPDYLLKETLWPRPERLVIDGGRLVIADPSSNDPPRVVDLAGQPELRAFTEAVRAPLAGDLAALRRGFDVALAGGWTDWTLSLTPRGASRVVTAIRVGGQEDWIGRIRTEAPNGDVTTLQISRA